MTNVEKMERGVNDLRAILSAGGECSLVDVREYPEFAAGKIREARLIQLGEIERRAEEINRDVPVYVICRSGRRSAIAQQKLQALGFKEVYNVRGGMLDWEASGFPVMRDERAPWSLERQVRLVAGVLVFASVLLSATVTEHFLWVAGFIGAGLAFAAITDTCAMGMLLARMPWNRAANTGAEACSVERVHAEE
ncbi:MAG TPA: rhodanese-like domain-containing protein [Blastocatellia bacterium]